MSPEEVSGLLPPTVCVVSSPIDGSSLDTLDPAEAVFVAKAVDKRRREFATARGLARIGLERIGATVIPIVSAPDRSPIWPAGVVGSISHCNTRAVVAVAASEVGTVGIDIEHRQELHRDLWGTVFLASEIAQLDAFPSEQRGRLALTLFSAKESLYKAQHPITKTYMGFHELAVELVRETATRGVARCTFQNAVRPELGGFSSGEVVLGRYALDVFETGEVVTAVHLAPRR